MVQTTQKIRAWVATPAIRDPIRVPSDVRGAAYIVAVIRALLLDNRLSASDDYQELVARLSPEVQAIRAETEALVSDNAWMERATERGKRWGQGLVPSLVARLGPQIFGAVDVFRKWQSPAHQQGFEAFDAKATEFTHRWLFGSETGRQVLWALVTVDAAGADPLAIDWQRAERSETWQAAYGEHKTRLDRKHHKTMMQRLKYQGWGILKAPEMLATTCDWVECYHVYKGLSPWLLSQGAGYDALGNASKRFEDLEIALGIRKGRGRPPRVTPSV